MGNFSWSGEEIREDFPEEETFDLSFKAWVGLEGTQEAKGHSRWKNQWRPRHKDKRGRGLLGEWIVVCWAWRGGFSPEGA